MAVSSFASTKLEDIASAATDCLLWMQLFIFQDRELTKSIVKIAERSGYQAVVLTVDSAAHGQRMNNMRNDKILFSHLRFPNIEVGREQGNTKERGANFPAYLKSLIKSDIDWSTVDWLKSVTKLPIILKGILTAEDARKAVQHGVAGIAVSNHGGRQLDTAPAAVGNSYVLGLKLQSSNVP